MDVNFDTPPRLASASFGSASSTRTYSPPSRAAGMLIASFMDGILCGGCSSSSNHQHLDEGDYEVAAVLREHYAATPIKVVLPTPKSHSSNSSGSSSSSSRGVPTYCDRKSPIIVNYNRRNPFRPTPRHIMDDVPDLRIAHPLSPVPSWCSSHDDDDDETCSTTAAVSPPSSPTNSAFSKPNLLAKNMEGTTIGPLEEEEFKLNTAFCFDDDDEDPIEVGRSIDGVFSRGNSMVIQDDECRDEDDDILLLVSDDDEAEMEVVTTVKNKKSSSSELPLQVIQNNVKTLQRWSWTKKNSAGTTTQQRDPVELTSRAA